ncbi:SCO family protein [Comamonas sp. Y33R10-2]|uniref:SCO family protein n=1 Tax=Comamonas sp. Y33R10-2 TaxID=2853257 RepID=UPI001C5C9D43|nr:SCO family protein [Comamonas sp. Y33R10-2]QXZ09505.1 SCO family protein [Comamonas sp. Y33R10-2]
MDKRAVLRTLGAATLAGMAAFTLSACKGEKKPAFQGVDVTGAEYAKDIPLTDVNGQKRSLKDFSGKVVAVFFGYTQCPDVCPTTMQELKEVKEALGSVGAKLQAIFISLDPERDTPEVLKAYMANFDESFVGLTGTPDEIAAVAKDFKIYFKKVPGKAAGTYTLDHSAGTYLYDTQGRLRVYERYGAGPQVLTQDVKSLLL